MSICPTEADERFNEFFSSVQEDFARLRAERDALAKDAMRYRWLRRNCQYGFDDHDDGPQLVHRNGETGPHQNAHWREDLDAAIDAAMEGQP